MIRSPGIFLARAGAIPLPGSMAMAACEFFRVPATASMRGVLPRKEAA